MHVAHVPRLDEMTDTCISYHSDLGSRLQRPGTPIGCWLGFGNIVRRWQAQGRGSIGSCADKLSSTGTSTVLLIIHLLENICSGYMFSAILP